jgi:hypothetical protein
VSNTLGLGESISLPPERMECGSIYFSADLLLMPHVSFPLFINDNYSPRPLLVGI